MSITSSQIVHENETQRQFIRLQLPAMADINGVRFTVKDLSSGGMAVRDVPADFKTGQIHGIKLILPFADFTLDIEIKAEIQYIDKKLKVAGCRFIDLKPSQLSILNQVIQSFISGDIMDGGDILNVVSRENFVNVRKNNEDYSLNKIEKLRVYSIYTLVAVAIILVSSFIIGNIMDRLFVIKTSQAQVLISTIDIKNPINGTFQSSLPTNAKTVQKGDEVAVIKSPIGNIASKIMSPCDCYIAEQHILEGQYSALNTTLFTFIDITEKPVVEAYIDTENLSKIDETTEAIISITGMKQKIKGRVVSSHLSAVNHSPSLAPSQAGRLVIEPSTSLPIDFNNRHASVELHL